MSTQPTLSNFTVASRVFGSAPFDLTNPTTNNLNPLATFTFTSSNTTVADISGRTVTIKKVGQTVITATQAPAGGYTSGSITAFFTVNVATPTLTNFVIAPKSFEDVSFTLVDPSSNSSGTFTFRSITTDIVIVTGRIVTIKRPGIGRIEATQEPATNYTSNSIIAEFDVLSSIVRVGVQNQIDLSWNRPVNNGATIKNYFFYMEERVPSTYLMPVSSVIAAQPTVPDGSYSYYSYALPVPYYSPFLSSLALPTGADINVPVNPNILSTSLDNTMTNYFDLGYYGEIEISWVYHNDYPIAALNPSEVAQTIMNLTIYKEASASSGDNRINLVLNKSRLYDSATNCLGPMPQNNGKLMTDIFDITFDSGATRALKYLQKTDVVSGKVEFSSLSYSPADDPTGVRTYSIIVKGIRIVPFRLPISRDFTSASFGVGDSTTGLGFSVNTNTGTSPGILYYMPKMTRPFTAFNEATFSISWNYGVNLARLTTDISFLPIQTITQLAIPFQLRIRGYSRPYSKMFVTIPTENYNTSSVPTFLSNVADTNYNTRLLFDISRNYTARYSNVIVDPSTNALPMMTQIFDISGVGSFPAFSESQDPSHTQMVYLFQLTITDASYNAYFQSIASAAAADAILYGMTNSPANAFQVKMLTQSITPRQEYRFAGPDPTLASSNQLTSTTNTLYNISNPYTDIRAFYRFYNLTNGVYYSYKIASNNLVGTNSFSELMTRRCGSVPNQIVNTINSAGKDTYFLESEQTSNQVILFWDKPSFSGYEILNFVIQMNIDVSGQWLNILDYTPDVSHNTLTFNTFEDTVVPIGSTATEQEQPTFTTIINTYAYKSLDDALLFSQKTGISVSQTGSLINGYKYYFRIASVNQLGYSVYSQILSGIPFSHPKNSPITFIGNPVVGNQLVYLTWKIPNDDGGSPILNYLIDYFEVIPPTTPGGSNKYVNQRRYKLDINEPTRDKYPFDDFRTVYAGVKRFDLLSPSEQTSVNNLRAELTRYIIPPTPIIFDDPDYNQKTALDPPYAIPNRNVIMNYTTRSFTYISSELTQNVFDISNIQLKWYYFNDPAGSPWLDDNTTVSFLMSIRGHLQHVSNPALDISNIFYIPSTTTYNVRRPLLSIKGTYKYIDYTNGLQIAGSDVSFIPKIYTPSLPRIDSANTTKRYYLKIEYNITYISSSVYRFILYSGRMIINGTAPVRTNPTINTKFTLRIANNALSPILNNKTYLFRITPFNINAFFPDPSNNNQTEVLIGIDNADPVTDMSYSLVSTSSGGKVVLQWKYTSTSDYYINIVIPPEYYNSNYPAEYPLTTLSDGTTRSILVNSLKPTTGTGIVTYTIPSDIPSDISANNAQQYLKSGRGYIISVAPVKSIEITQGQVTTLVAPYRDMYATDTFIIPFRVPLSPLALSAFGNNGLVLLKWKLPDITMDPNFYKTNSTPNYYSYRYYTLESRDISANSAPSAPWNTVAAEIEIPALQASVPGYETQYTVSGLTNENNHQFRVRLMIINNYTSSRAYSEYIYMTMVNNVPVIENSGNTVYPSVYPYKPSAPVLLYVERSLSIRSFSFMLRYPSYNGNADYYECYVEYRPPGDQGDTWSDIFNTTPGIGIATLADNTAILTNGKIRTTSAVVNNTQMITVNCSAIVLAYSIRIRLLGRKTGLSEPYPSRYLLYSDYSTTGYISI